MVFKYLPPAPLGFMTFEPLYKNILSYEGVFLCNKFFQKPKRV